jgi:hypothetical protein
MPGVFAYWMSMPHIMGQKSNKAMLEKKFGFFLMKIKEGSFSKIQVVLCLV